MDRASYIREIEACEEMLYRVAYTILQNEQDVQDALQDAALRAWEKRDRLRDESLFRTWITRICINACYDVRRRRRRMIPMETLPEQAAPVAPDIALQMALLSLPEKLRLPLVLCYSEGMTYEEAARALRLPVATIRGRIARGKKELRKELDAE